MVVAGARLENRKKGKGQKGKIEGWWQINRGHCQPGSFATLFVSLFQTKFPERRAKKSLLCIILFKKFTSKIFSLLFFSDFKSNGVWNRRVLPSLNPDSYLPPLSLSLCLLSLTFSTFGDYLLGRSSSFSYKWCCMQCVSDHPPTLLLLSFSPPPPFPHSPPSSSSHATSW